MRNLRLVLDECVFYELDDEIYYSKDDRKVTPKPNSDGIPTAYGYVATCKIVVPYAELLEALKEESFDPNPDDDGSKYGEFYDHECREE